MFSDSDTMQAKGPNLFLTLFVAAAICLTDLVHSQKGKENLYFFKSLIFIGENDVDFF